MCAALLAPLGASAATLTKVSVVRPDTGSYVVETDALSPAGDRLAVSTYTISTVNGAVVVTPWIHMYAVAPDGSVTEVPGSPFNEATNGVAGVLKFSPDGQRLVAIFPGDKFGLFTVSPSGALTFVPPGPFSGGISPLSASFAPDGKHLAIGSEDGVRIFAIGANGSPTAVPGSPFQLSPLSMTRGVAYSPDGGFLAVADDFSGVRIQVVAPDGGIATAVPGSPFGGIHPTLDPAFSPDGKLLAVGYGGTLSMFSVAGSGVATPITGSPFSSAAREIAWSPDGKLIAAADVGGGTDFSVYGVRADGVPRPVPGSPFPLGQAGLSFGGSLFAISAPTFGVVTIYKVGKMDQTITFPSQGPSVYGGGPLSLGAMSSSGLPLTYAVAAGPCQVSGARLTFTGAGLCSVTADQPGDADYDPAPQVSNFFRANSASQTVAFPDPGSRRFGDPPVALLATSTSGLGVAYSVTSGPCTVKGKNLTLTGAGSCVVAADQPGTSDYQPAPRVSRRVDVAKGEQTVSFPEPGPHEVGDPPIALGATSTSGLPVVYGVASGPCTVTADALTLTGAGLCVVTADQAGDANRAAAATVSRAVAVTTPPTASVPLVRDTAALFSFALAASSPAAPAGHAVPCGGLSAARLLRCAARLRYIVATRRCNRLVPRTTAGRRQRTACVGTAKLLYRRALALARCQVVTRTPARVSCVAQARRSRG